MVNVGGLSRIFELIGLTYSGSVSAYLHCPLHQTDTFVQREEVPTMRIFPTLDGDFLFRCHGCGENLDSLELIARMQNMSFDAASQLMLKEKIISATHSPAEIRQHTVLESVQKTFRTGVATYFASFMQDQGRRAFFGDWAYLDDYHAQCLFPRTMFSSKVVRANYLVRRIRNAFGRVVAIALHTENYIPIGLYPLAPVEPVTFSTTRWSDYTDIGELVVCDGWGPANWLEESMCHWPQNERIPIAVPEESLHFPIAYRSPFKRVLFAPYLDRRLYRGLAFHREGETKVDLLESLWDSNGKYEPSEMMLTRQDVDDRITGDCMEVVSRKIVRGAEGTLASRLNEALQAAEISDETKRILFDRCCALSSKTAAEMIHEVDPASSPYSLKVRGRRFLMRNGIYLMYDRKKRWHEISNFGLAITRRSVAPNGDAVYELLLSVQGKQSLFSVSAALLDNASRLWRETRRHAALAGQPELVMANPQHRALLPSLVKGISPLTVVNPPAVPVPNDPGGQTSS